MQNEVLKLDSRDNVVIALADLHQGQDVRVGNTVYHLRSNVPAKQKFATDDLPVGADVIMYGVLVGKAVKPVDRVNCSPPAMFNTRRLAFMKSPRNIPGPLPPFRTSSSGRFWDTNGRMGRSARGTTGWWFP
jgi:hypothetical protein